MSNSMFVPSMKPLLYHYAFNFEALSAVDPEQYPVWLHEHAELLKQLASTRDGYVPVGIYLAALSAMQLYDATVWYRDRFTSRKTFQHEQSTELIHVAITHATMVAHMEGATFQNDTQLLVAADRLHALLVFEAKLRSNDFTHTILYQKVTLDPDVTMSHYVS